MNLKNKNVTIFLILVIVICTCFFSIKILSEIKMNMEINDVLTQNIENTNWPKSVPIIQSKFINITKLNDKSWELNIKEYISYNEFREYLIDLYSEGFEPIKELGSDNPKRLSTNEPTEENFVLLWSGKNENYNVEAYWNNIEGSEVERDSVTILLYDNLAVTPDLGVDVENEVKLDSGDLISGEILKSGELYENTLLNSGE